MINKKELLSNLREYSSDQVAEAINSGVVTLYELSKSGNLTPLMRKRIEEKLSQSANAVQEHVAEVPVEIAESATQDTNANNVDVRLQPSHSDETSSTEFSNDENEKNAEEQAQEDNPDEVLSNKGMFKRPFSFKGRIRRLEYGISFIIYYLWYFIMEAMMQGDDPSAGACIFTLITFVPMIWFIWAQGAKRCHDRGNSGWYQIIPFYFFWMLFAGGEGGINYYGDNPKE